jgi:hypothetical protein
MYEPNITRREPSKKPKRIKERKTRSSRDKKKSSLYSIARTRVESDGVNRRG